MAFVDDPEQDPAEVAKGLQLLRKQGEAANSGDVPRVVAAEILFRSLPEDVQTVSRQRLDKKDGGGKEAFRGEGRRLSDSTFKDDDERESQRKAARERAQARYDRGEAPFGGPVDDSQAFSGAGAKQQSSPPNKSAFTGEGNRLSDWPFESDQDRDRERREAMETAQARYSAGLAPFEGEKDVSRIPWAPKTEEPSSSSTRLRSDLQDAIRSRRPFSSGATNDDVDPVAHIENDLIPADPNHGAIRSEARKRRQFASGASDEYMDVQAIRGAYQNEVDSTIRQFRREQPQKVGELDRLWKWITAEIDDSSEDLQHRVRQLPRIEELLIEIEQAHNELETKRREAEKKHIRALRDDIATVSTQVGDLLKGNFKVLSGDDAWKREYDDALKYFKLVEGDPASQTEDNLIDLQKRWRKIDVAAKKLVAASTTSSSTAALKIGLDPYDTNEQATIYGYYSQSGGLAPKGQVITVCQNEDKYGGTYTYKGHTYDMFHDSHGPMGGNSNKSRTAWKIEINGKLQVVGIGHHSPSGDYEAIFPFSDDPVLKPYSASPTITDSRK